MDFLSEKAWDVVICGTGLSQSLLALALSRSEKNILHFDANDFYGEHEAALTLEDASAWIQAYAGASATQQLDDCNPVASKDGNCQDASGGNGAAGVDAEQLETVHENAPTESPPTLSETKTNIFRNATEWKHPNAEAEGLSSSRRYSIVLAPQIIHAKSKLVSQLVSSKSHRQLEFLAVGSFFVYTPADATSNGRLARIPSSREDVFSAQSIPPRSKRMLMKFLKFVIDYDSEEQTSTWHDSADKPLSEYLVDEFKLDESLRNYILALTLTLDGKISVKDGLATIHRHLTSMGIFGPGFCAVYPKWGGLSEIAQVGCRAGAVGGGIYMLNTKASVAEQDDGEGIRIDFPDDVSIRTPIFISSQQASPDASGAIARLVAIVKSPLESLFGNIADGGPPPAVAIVSFPSNSLPGLDVPVYAFVHSSVTGECPLNQSVVYLTMQAQPRSSELLNAALTALLEAAAAPATECLYKLYYEQVSGSRTLSVISRGSATVLELPSPSLGLAFEDASLDAVEEAWKVVMKDGASDSTYMTFEDRNGMGDDDEAFLD